jgi:subtilisin family serine protease
MAIKKRAGGTRKRRPKARAGAVLEGYLAAAPAVPAQAIAARAPRAAQLAINAVGTRLAPVKDAKLAAMVAMDMAVETSMDPRLQLAVVNRRSGRRALVTSSTSEDEVAVVARVQDVQAWESIPDVLPGSVLGRAQEGFIVTGRIDAARVAAVRSSPAVLSLKASQPVHASLAKTVESMRVRADLLPPGVKPNGGAGVIVGIVDFGGDFAHPNFRKADGSTRLLALWDQAGKTRAGDAVKYGRLYASAEINTALKAASPYAALGYNPRWESQGTHGTHVMDIAAGNGRGTKVPGVAPNADLIFVEASVRDIAWQGPDVVGKSFGDSVMLLEAMRFIVDQAGDRPCVVNVSLGTNGGPHDGTSLVEQGIDALLREKPNRAVVIAAGNAQLDGIHAQGTIAPNATADLVWKVEEVVGGEFECWYDGAARMEATLIGPDGTAFGPVAPDANSTIMNGTQPAIFISNRLNDPNNRQNQVNIWIAADVAGGEWTVRLRLLSATAIPYHAWIERNDEGQGSFKAPASSHALGSISTGFESIVVGSYDAHKPGFPLSSFSSAGPTRDGRHKPELSAPGHHVLAAWSRSPDALTRKSGTSMAAPAVSGLIALVYAEAKRGGKSLTIEQLRQKLLAALDDPPPAAGGGWDAGYGQGRACAKAI